MKNYFAYYLCICFTLALLSCSQESKIKAMIERESELNTEIEINSQPSKLDVSEFINRSYNNRKDELSPESLISYESQLYKLYHSKDFTEIAIVEQKMDSIRKISKMIDNETIPDEKFQKIITVKKQLDTINSNLFKFYLCRYNSDFTNISYYNRLIVFNKENKLIIDFKN